MLMPLLATFLLYVATLVAAPPCNTRQLLVLSTDRLRPLCFLPRSVEFSHSLTIVGG